MNILTELEQLFILENAFVFKAEKKKQISILQVALKYYSLGQIPCIQLNHSVYQEITKYHNPCSGIPMIVIYS